MSGELSALLITAASIGFFHTMFGPDHYLPFIVMSGTGSWSFRKTAWITFLCGLGHVMSSVVLGLIGIAFGIAVSRLTAVESLRGNIAAWGLIAFGLVYFVWGLRRAARNTPHTHFHAHADGITHRHTHVHEAEHLHVHESETANRLTPWVLFTIFVLGPCEPLIPLLMYPAAQNSSHGLIMVTLVFGSVTILTMMTIVMLSVSGMNFLPVSRMERYTHALAGAAIFLCGIAIQFLGL